MRPDMREPAIVLATVKGKPLRGGPKPGHP
jgi:hypothetical protein